MTHRASKSVGILPASAVVAALAAGYAAYRYIPLLVWEPSFPGLLVAISMLGAAVLVRLARNAPITAPAAFDAGDLKLFFSTLEVLSKRLFALFIQVLFLLVAVLASIITSQKMRTSETDDWIAIAPFLSFSLGALLFWLLFKLVEMAYGDIGFLKLQRHILERAVNRERDKEARRRIESPAIMRSGGAYGRELPPPSQDDLTSSP